MIIGNIPKRYEVLEIGKWYIGLEINKCPPALYGVFKPELVVFFCKFTKKPREYETAIPQRGFWRVFVSPLEISLEIGWKHKRKKIF